MNVAPQRVARVTRVFVGNIAPTVSPKDLIRHFSITAFTDIGAMPVMEGFGIIEYTDPLKAIEAVLKYNGTSLKGNRLSVSIARTSQLKSRPHAFQRVSRLGLRSHSNHSMDIRALDEYVEGEDLRDYIYATTTVDALRAEIDDDGHAIVDFQSGTDLDKAIDALGKVEDSGLTFTRLKVDEPVAEDMYITSKISQDLSGTPARPSADLSALARGPSTPNAEGPEKMYITSTISQDLSGTAEEIISIRLAALGA